MNEDDPLAKWQRKTGSGPVPPVLVKDSRPQQTAKEDYQGEDGKDRANGWLELRPLKGPRLVCSYAQLREWEYNGPNATCITLYFAVRVVTVRGRNLDRLALGLHSRALNVIEQFDPARHEKPADDAPIIESIDMATAH